jgi:putative SOS response-associated peptidase YedK
MCGRFTQCLSWDEIHRLADLIGQPRNLRPRYNIAPTTQIEVVRRHDGGRELVPMRLGPCADVVEKAAHRASRNINARAETVAEKPMFRSAFKSRRCIIHALGCGRFL